MPSTRAPSPQGSRGHTWTASREPTPAPSTLPLFHVERATEKQRAGPVMHRCDLDSVTRHASPRQPHRLASSRGFVPRAHRAPARLPSPGPLTPVQPLPHGEVRLRTCSTWNARAQRAVFAVVSRPRSAQVRTTLLGGAAALSSRCLRDTPQVPATAKLCSTWNAPLVPVMNARASPTTRARGGMRMHHGARVCAARAERLRAPHSTARVVHCEVQGACAPSTRA